MKALRAMKTMCAMLMMVLLAASCDKDGDNILLSGLEGGKLVAMENEVKLTQETSKQLALSLAWSNSTLSINNPNMDVPDILTTYIQVSTESDFSSNVVESLETTTSKAYTGAELNTVTKNLSVEGGVSTVLYFRLKGSIGNNIDPVYSNVVEVKVTSYTIDMSNGYILNSKMEETGGYLYSAASNGVYSGFMGATAWYNYYLKEGDGTIWGNDGVDGTAFLMSSENDTDKRWNFWFPGEGGCYYVEVNTPKKVWSALLIPTLTVSGDVNAEMVFDRANLKWTTTINAATAKTLKLKLNGTGKQYDYSTGDSAPVTTSVAFSQSGTSLALSAQAGEIAVAVPAAGEYALTVDLSNPKEWKCEVVSGSSGPVEVSSYLYLSGIDDGINGGSWTFDNFLNLYNEDDLAYAGVINVNSLWGYGVYTEKDNWYSAYKQASGDAFSGTLVSGGSTSIPAPTAGLYLFDVSMKALTYKLSAVGSSIYVSGLNELWDFSTVLSATSNTGEYSGNITITKASEWGFQIHLDISWNHYFGGSNGKLSYKGNNLTEDKTLAAGTYKMTVNLIKGTYSITK